MHSVNLARRCIRHVIQAINCMGDKDKSLISFTPLIVCVNYSLSLPLLRRLQCELTSFIFSPDRVVF
jgi:hypothetical protein